MSTIPSRTEPFVQAFTNEQKRKAVAREIAFRRRVYARKVVDGTMSANEASFQLAIFEAIEKDYADKEVQERLL